MQTRFILPVIVATAFHALVFFGFNSSDIAVPTAPPTSDPTPPPRDALVPIIEVVDDDPSASPVDNDAPKRPQLGSGERPIGLPEDLPSRPRVDWEIPVDPVNPGTRITDHIPRGPFGVPDGEEGGLSEGPVIGVQFLDDPPRTRSQVAPIYPAEAKSLGLTGQVLVEFVVDENGRVINARAIESTATVFEAPTLRAVQHWRFEPGRKSGRPVRFRMVAPVVFNLDR